MPDRSRGSRPLKTRVKASRSRTESSRRWLERQLNDPYVARARREGYRARSAYKLIEIDDRQHVLKPGQTVVDLGAAPGGWSQVAASRVDAGSGRGHVVAIDLLPIDPIPGVTVLQLDFTDDDAPDRITAALPDGGADVVLSDLAAPTTGHRRTDHLRTVHLTELAADFACRILKPGGALLAKVFRGGTEATLLAELKRQFGSVRHVKPPASRAESVELYLLATGFRDTPD